MNHYLIFNIWWLSTFLLTINNPHYPPVSELAHSVFLIGLLSFNLTIFFIRPIKKNNLKVRTEWYLNIKHRRIIEIIVILCSMPALMDSMSMFLSGKEYWIIRGEVSQKETSYTVAALSAYICTPLSSFLYVTAYYKYYTNLKKNSYTINIIIAVVIVIIECLSTGARTGLINFILLYLIVCVCYRSNKYRFLLNVNAKFKPIFLLLPASVIILISMSRNLINEDVSLLSLLEYSYGLYGGLFDYYLTGDGKVILNNNTYGLSTFEGVYLLMNYPFKIMFNADLFNYEIVDSIIQEFVLLKNGEYRVNAHVSMYFRFIRDWGMLGIVIGPMLMAIVYNYIYKLANKRNIYYLLYFFILMQINYTTFDNYLCKNNFIVFLLWFCIITKYFTKKRNVIINNNSYI